jgi:hypothetical protein
MLLFETAAHQPRPLPPQGRAIAYEACARNSLPQVGGGLGRGKPQPYCRKPSLASPTPALPRVGRAIACKRIASPLVGEGYGALASAASLGGVGWGGPPHDPLREAPRKQRAVPRSWGKHVESSPPTWCGGTPQPNLPPQGGKGLTAPASSSTHSTCDSPARVGGGRNAFDIVICDCPALWGKGRPECARPMRFKGDSSTPLRNLAR